MQELKDSKDDNSNYSLFHGYIKKVNMEIIIIVQ